MKLKKRVYAKFSVLSHLSLPQYGSDVFCLIFLRDNNLLPVMSLRDENSELISATSLKPTFHS